MDINLFRGLMTALLLVIFIGIVIWAWMPARKKRFDEAARLPLDDEKEDDK
ncbi:MAG: cbb3-type cytochrome c oxidase subunit 3 [Xanthomonadaceae bacterium]|nr:cbb3-type cytochrome c oxidase subunit 3 [Xanthomonadaceae bacterium]